MENDEHKESTDTFRERKLRQMQAANEELVKRRAQRSTEKQSTAQPAKEIQQTHFQVSGHTGMFYRVDIECRKLFLGSPKDPNSSLQCVVKEFWVPMYVPDVKYSSSPYLSQASVFATYK